MEQKEFLKNFEAEFDDVPAGTLTEATELESIEEWGSLQALSIIAMLDSKYKIKVTGAELQEAKTVGEVYVLAQSKLKS
jgi:acyl carrier protein